MFSSPRDPSLPTFTATPPRSGTSTPSRFGGSSPPLGAVAEKVALSYKRASRKSIFKRTKNLFVPIKIPLSRYPQQSSGGAREISIPVLAIFHPQRAPIFSTTRNSKRRTSEISFQPPSIFRIFLAIIFTAGTLILFLLVSLIFILKPLFLRQRPNLPFMEPSTLIFTPSQIEKIWKWEIAAGNFPSRRSIGINFATQNLGATDSSLKIENPGLPKLSESDLLRELRVEAEVLERLREQTGRRQNSNLLERAQLKIVGVGPARNYYPVPIPGGTQSAAYPPRPELGSVLDLDRVMQFCDFSTKQFVRDCLEVLRISAGMEQPLRRGKMTSWETTYRPTLESAATTSDSTRENLERLRRNMSKIIEADDVTFDSLLASRQQLTLSSGHASTSSRHVTHPTADLGRDPDHPQIFHIFWAGPFTDKPYSAALSFLYTQHLQLDKPIGATLPETICRPQLWIWINPGPASSLPDKSAVSKMRKDLKANPWSAPLLHARFDDVIKFKLWNTTEQLDGVSELSGWREMDLFNSGGVKFEKAKVNFEPREEKILAEERKIFSAGENLAEASISAERQLQANLTVTNASAVAEPLPTKAKDEFLDRVGSTAQKYDRLTVVLSDMARFVLTHRFGGIYLDADTILLRDWSQLFGWHGAFAYRWSRLEKYNTAVLKMSRGSALGNFIFKTAVANGLDFHPMTISRYTKDSGLDNLLLRLPDALFDPAWLNTEYYQRDRPPFPYFQRFEDFFETPKEVSAAATAGGFHSFFKGAFSYHFHNFWWIPFDRTRNFPDLGPRFAQGERLARGRLLAAQLKNSPKSSKFSAQTSSGPSPTAPGAQITADSGQNRGNKVKIELGPRWGDDERDFDALDWSQETVSDDDRDLSWSAVLKRTFESFVRGETPNLYGEFLNWDELQSEDFED